MISLNIAPTRTRTEDLSIILFGLQVLRLTNLAMRAIWMDGLEPETNGFTVHRSTN